MKYAAFVLHNVSPDMFWGYKPESSRLYHAHTFQIEADNTNRVADLIWILTNVDSADALRVDYPHLAKYADQVTAYRQRKNRSLSVGDVVLFYQGEKPLVATACESLGWKDYTPQDLFDPDADHEPVSQQCLADLHNARSESQAYEAMQDLMREQANTMRNRNRL